MIKLPEPACYHYFDDAAGTELGPPRPYYTADQLKQAILDVLEEAAKVCDGEGEEAYSYHAAERIRKLKEDIQ